ncbi:MAG: hypothetical protein BV456_03140 [Thermoplasmata archaeon M8B2D]|nr:MAG: hypothetical protein BV456_03140 [Thermoplasmata archaeon M8B2D]
MSKTVQSCFSIPFQIDFNNLKQEFRSKNGSIFFTPNTIKIITDEEWNEICKKGFKNRFLLRDKKQKIEKKEQKKIVLKREKKEQKIENTEIKS